MDILLSIKKYNNLSVIKTMTIKQFIEKAIEGGWNYEPALIDVMIYGSVGGDKMPQERVVRLIADPTFSARVFLDPEVWKAVGKVLGWAEMKFYPFDSVHPTGMEIPEAQWYFRCMGNALWSGKTLEEYISTL